MTRSNYSVLSGPFYYAPAYCIFGCRVKLFYAASLGRMFHTSLPLRRRHKNPLFSQPLGRLLVGDRDVFLSLYHPGSFVLICDACLAADTISPFLALWSRFCKKIGSDVILKINSTDVIVYHIIHGTTTAPQDDRPPN